MFVSGENNFRKEIDPNYKANRSQPSPKWREVCKQHLIDKYGAIEAHGCEADDYCGIYQSDSTIICGIDKDLLQIPGKHWSWEIVRKDKVVRPSQFHNISELDGLKNFYKQVLTGDTSDNIIGIKGIGPVKASKLIDGLETEEEIYTKVYDVYTEDCEDDEEMQFNIDRMQKNCNLLWIMRELGVMYEDRTNFSTTF